MRSGEPPVPATLPLLCALGRHKTDGLARWNAGYYFARCTRCRRDLVRTAFTRWQIPRGFRVVWQGDGPQAHGGEGDRHVVPAGQVEFPLRDEPILAPPAALVAGESIGDPPGTDDNFLDSHQREASTDAESSDDIAAAYAPDGASADARSETPSWFDGDHGLDEHGLDEEVRFSADDRLADYIPPEAEEAEEAEGASEAAAASEPELEPEPEPEPEAPPPPPVSSKYPVVPDFMDEGPAGVGWDVVSGHIVPRAGAVPPPDVRSDAGRDVLPGLLSQGWQDLVRKRAQGAGEQGREWLRGKRSARPQPEAEPPAIAPAPAPASRSGDGGPAETSKPRVTVGDAPPSAVPAPSTSAPHQSDSRSARTRPLSDTLLQHSPLAAALVFGALVLAAAVVDGRNSPPRVVYRPPPATTTLATPLAPTVAAPPVTRPAAAEAAAAGWRPVQSDVAYVTAGLLNCRATPSNDAETVRRLSRGAPLRVLGQNPGWVSVAHQGQQCWVSAQHLSPSKPA